MRKIILFLFLLVRASIYGQQTDTTNLHNKDSSNTVSFIVTFDKKKATKDGYYVGDYIADINNAQAQKLDGKKIKITGSLYLVKGLKKQAPKYDEKGNLIMNQGRWEDIKHIASPSIEMIDTPGIISGSLFQGNTLFKKTDPMPNVKISLIKKPSDTITASTKTDSTGTYQFTNVKEGAYSISLRIPGRILENTYTIVVTSSDTIFNNMDFIADAVRIYMDDHLHPK